MIKLIASDLDGTLFNDDHKVPEAVVTAIEKYQEAGYEFVAVTGREFASIKTHFIPSGIKCEAIVLSGAEIRDKDGNVIGANCISYDILEKIEELTEGIDVHVGYYTADDYRAIVTPEEKVEFLVDEIQMLHLNGTREEVLSSKIYQERDELLQVISSAKEFRENGVGVEKVFIFGTSMEEIQKTKDALSVLSDEVAILASFAKTVEVNELSVQKGLVLKKYIEERGYQMDEVAVVGDSLNDISMYEQDFGAKVVVANGSDIIKDVATHITKSNNEAGIAHLIDKILAGQLDDLKK